MTNGNTIAVRKPDGAIMMRTVSPDIDYFGVAVWSPSSGTIVADPTVSDSFA